LAFIFATGCGIAWGSRLVTEIFSKTLQAQFRGESTDILMLWIGLVMAIAAIPAGIFAVKIGNAKAMIGGIVAIIPAMFFIVYVGINIGTLILAVAAYSLILNGVIPFALSSVSSLWSGLVIGALLERAACAFRANSSMNDDFFSITQRRKGAKFRCLFL
jgi:hypothetical protein